MNNPIIAPVMFVLICCTIRATKAKIQKAKPKNANNADDFTFFESLKLTKFTKPKMSKNPALPDVEILSKLNVFAMNKVSNAVTKSPTG